MDSKKKRLLFVINPFSGKAEIKSYLADIIDLFIKYGYVVTVHTTQAVGDARELISSVSGYDLIVVSGGDGTLNESVSGLMENPSQIKLGYIPSGTTNDFASSLGISSSIMDSARDIMEGKVFWCDVGKFCEDRYFSYIAAFGAFTDVSYSTPQQFKNIFGRAAYILEGIKQLPSLKKHSLSFSANGFLNGSEISDEFIFGMVSNSNSVAGIKNYSGREVLMDDGLLEVLFVKAPKNALELQLLINDILAQNFSSKLFYSFKTDRITFSSKAPLDWTLDGEFGGSRSFGEISVRKQGLGIIINNQGK